MGPDTITKENKSMCVENLRGWTDETYCRPRLDIIESA